MKAGIIAIGSEMLHAGRVDTNSSWLAERLARAGVELVARRIVGDDVEEIADAVRQGWRRGQLLLLTGGLGPTEDDRTREALASALDVPLEIDARMLARLRERYPSVQSRLAARLRGADWIDNPVGTAPGLFVSGEEGRAFALPGVPSEMRKMYAEFVEPWLRSAGYVRTSARRTLKIVGLGEPAVDDRLRDVQEDGSISISVLASIGFVEVHLFARDTDAGLAERKLGQVEALLADRFGQDLFGRDDETLAAVVGAQLRSSGRSVATAESCTAGMLGAALTDEPGSSFWYRGGMIVYHDDLKRELVGVEQRQLAEHGAVSEKVARLLAAGARRRCRADYGVGITGIAGPSGGTTEKPVGLVHIAVDGPNGCRHRRTENRRSTREAVRRRSVIRALDMLRRIVLEDRSQDA